MGQGGVWDRVDSLLHGGHFKNENNTYQWKKHTRVLLLLFHYAAVNVCVMKKQRVIGVIFIGIAGI